MTYESQRVLSQGRSDSDAQETPGVKTINPRRPRLPGTKARRYTSIQVGDRFGRLTAVAPTSQKMGIHKCWIFRCDCGWVGPKRSYQTRLRGGRCRRSCPFRLVDCNRRPDGWGYIDRDGYIKVLDRGRLVSEHRVVWERAHGPVPDGMQIHHKDFNPGNNDLSNLQLVTPLEHRRIHVGWSQVDGVWFKPCTRCGNTKAASEFYMNQGHCRGECKVCVLELRRIDWATNRVRILQRRKERKTHR